MGGMNGHFGCVCGCVWLGKVKEATDREGVDWTEKSSVLFFPPESEREG